MFIFTQDRIPDKITPCPIKDVAAEIRYSDDIPLEVIVGLLYNSFSNDAEKYKCKMPQKLPINEIPSNVRLNDPNLRFQAHYVIDIGNNIVVRISLNGISISVQGAYIGWKTYYEYITSILQIIFSLNLIHNPNRLGLRYTSFFDNDISDDIFVNLNIANNNFVSAKNYIRSEWVYEDNISCVLQISNNVTLNENEKSINGSLIDIDLSTATNKIDISSIQNLFKDFHDIEKKIFFSILKPEFLYTLNPEYST